MEFIELTEGEGRLRLVNLAHVTDVFPYRPNDRATTRTRLFFVTPEGQLDVRESYEQVKALIDKAGVR